LDFCCFDLLSVVLCWGGRVRGRGGARGRGDFLHRFASLVSFSHGRGKGGGGGHGRGGGGAGGGPIGGSEPLC